MKSKFLLIVCAALFLLCGKCAAWQSDSIEQVLPKATSSGNVVAHDAVAELNQADEAGVYHATVSLGKFPVGKKAAINLLLKNLGDQEIKFSKPARKCKCSDFKSSRNVIPANDETEARLQLRLPARSRGPATSVDLVLENEAKNRTAVKIRFEYELEGVVGFGQPIAVLVFDDDSEFKIVDLPVYTTLPVDFSNLEVKLSPKLKGLQTELVSGPDGGSLRVKVNQNDLTGGTIRGEVQITDKVSGRMDVAYLSIKDRRQSEISPRTIRFVQQDDLLKTTAIVRTGKMVKAEDAESPLEITCRCGDSQLVVDAKKLGKNIIRVELSLESGKSDALIAAAGDPDRSKLKWEIKQGSSSTTTETSFVIEEFTKEK